MRSEVWEAVTAGAFGELLAGASGAPDLAEVALVLAFASAGFLVRIGRREDFSSVT